MLGVLFSLTALSMLGCGANGSNEAKANKQGVVVTSETFVRAETDRIFIDIANQAGGVNKFYHYRGFIPLDQQTYVRLNNDTLHSWAIVDTTNGATITMPEITDGRYMSAHIVDNDHFTPMVFHGVGPHALPEDTQYVLIFVRTQIFNRYNAEEFAFANNLQDQMIITTNSAQPLPAFKWDRASLMALRESYNARVGEWRSSIGLMGPRDMPVGALERNVMAAAGWALLPSTETVYLPFVPSTPFNPAVGYTATYTVPDNDAFWSITVYNADGFMFSENSIVNSSNVTLNPDGTFTMYFGSADVLGDRPNRLDIVDGWNFMMRVYRPGESVINGEYILPAVMPVSQY